MSPPSHYDPASPDEALIALPSAGRIQLEALGASLQPPLTLRGHGPGLIIFLPSNKALGPATKRSLDPEPQLKWAEEGFAVVAVTCLPDDAARALQIGSAKLAEHADVDIKGRFAVIAYDASVLTKLTDQDFAESHIACVVSYGASKSDCELPHIVHAAQGAANHGKDDRKSGSNIVVHSYGTPSPYFVIPGYSTYHPGSAAIAHTRTLVFLRKHLGGPCFDIEKVWDEHTYFEFEVRSVAKTMATMVKEPYVNHVPTMTGGIGRENLTAFYRDHFIFNNPADLALEVVSRTVGPDRIIDEFIFRITHDRVVDWLLPGVPPTGKKLAIPMMSVVNVRGDRLYHEHIWWDQATALLQAGVLPTHVNHPQGQLRLPIAGEESARLLVDETDGMSNQMFGSGWGIAST